MSLLSQETSHVMTARNAEVNILARYEELYEIELPKPIPCRQI